MIDYLLNNVLKFVCVQITLHVERICIEPIVLIGFLPHNYIV